MERNETGMADIFLTFWGLLGNQLRVGNGSQSLTIALVWVTEYDEGGHPCCVPYWYLLRETPRVSW